MFAGWGLLSGSTGREKDLLRFEKYLFPIFHHVVDVVHHELAGVSGIFPQLIVDQYFEDGVADGLLDRRDLVRLGQLIGQQVGQSSTGNN